MIFPAVANLAVWYNYWPFCQTVTIFNWAV